METRNDPSLKIRILPETFTGLEIADPVMRMAARIALGTGIRISELLSLRIENLRANGEGIQIKEFIEIPITQKGSAHAKRPAKGNRVIYLPAYLRTEIVDYVVNQVHKTESWLFPSPEQGTGDRGERHHRTKEALSLKWHSWQVKQGWPDPYRWHDLRHTFACRKIDQGFNVAEVQLMLGHKSSATTAVYLHARIDKVAEKIEKLYQEKANALV